MERLYLQNSIIFREVAAVERIADIALLSQKELRVISRKSNRFFLILALGFLS